MCFAFFGTVLKYGTITLPGFSLRIHTRPVSTDWLLPDAIHTEDHTGTVDWIVKTNTISDAASASVKLDSVRNMRKVSL